MKSAYLISEKHKMAYLHNQVFLVMDYLLWWLTYTYLIRVKFFPCFFENAGMLLSVLNFVRKNFRN